MSAIQPVIQVLSQLTLYQTPPIFSPNQGILSSQIHFPTLNEDYVVQQIIQDYQQRKSQEQTAWRIGGAIIGLCFGLGDGFQIGDLFGSLIGSTAGGAISTELQRGDEAKLKELNLEWINTPESYIYHRRRHRGDALRRLILITPDSQTGQPRTTFAIQFPDGYVAHLAILESGTHFMFALAGSGFDTDWIQEKKVLGHIPTDVGISLPAELWHNPNYKSLVAIPYRTPHNSLY